MNKRGHVVNAILLSVGLGFLLEPSGGQATAVTILTIGVPVTLGALFPDVDTEFGQHRKTFHNLPLLAAFLAFPYFFENLEYVWIGVLTHYVLDVAGSRRGIALFYPLLTREFGLPIGVPADSRWADVVTVLVTAGELAVAAAFVHFVPEWGFEMGQVAFALL